jgi:hypothetical protein
LILRIGSVVPALLLGLLAGACSQDDPPEPADLADGGLAVDYYPLVDGASWSYWHSSRGGWQEDVTVTEEGVDEQGRATFRMTDTPNLDGRNSKSILVRDGAAVLRVYRDQFLNGEPELSVVYDPGFMRFDEAWIEQRVPFTETLTYQRTETDAGQQSQATTDRGHVFTMESLSETVEAEGRTFRNCVKVRRERVPGATSGTTAGTQGEEDNLYWYAPGVGKVRELNLTTGNTEVLVDFDIPE